MKSKKTAPARAKKRGTKAEAVGKATTKRSGEKASQPRSKLDIAMEALACPAVAGVFPVGENKLPLPGSHGYKDATDDVGEVVAMWEEHPDANVAVWLGPEYMVFDCDQKNGKDGLGELARFLRISKSKLLSMTFTNSTQSNGFHLIFKTDVPWGQRNSVLPGVDTRGVQGYILWPGDEFVDPKTGEVKEYSRYYNGVENFALLPKKLMRLHDPVQRKQKDTRPLVEEADTEENQAAFLEYLDNHEDEWDVRGCFTEGDRNDTVAKIIAPLGHDFGLSVDTLVDIAEPWLDERLGDCGFDIGYHLRSGYQSAVGPFGSRTKEGARALFEEEAESALEAFKSMAEDGADDSDEDSDESIDLTEAVGKHLFDDHAAVQAHIKQPVELIADWLPLADYWIGIIAERSSGKTRIIADQVAHLCYRDQWHSSPFLPKAKTLCIYLCGENRAGSRAMFERAFWQVTDGEHNWAPSQHFVFGDEIIQFKDEDRWLAWCDALEQKALLLQLEHGFTHAVLYIDTWQRATTGYSENDSRDMAEAVLRAEYLLRRLRQILPTASVAACHPVKDPRGRLTIRGSGLQMDQFGCLITLEPDARHPDKRLLTMARYKDGTTGHYKTYWHKTTYLNDEPDRFGRPRRVLDLINFEDHSPEEIAMGRPVADPNPDQDKMLPENEERAWSEVAVPVILGLMKEGKCTLNSAATALHRQTRRLANKQKYTFPTNIRSCSRKLQKMASRSAFKFGEDQRLVLHGTTWAVETVDDDI